MSLANAIGFFGIEATLARAQNLREKSGALAFEPLIIEDPQQDQLSALAA